MSQLESDIINHFGLSVNRPEVKITCPVCKRDKVKVSLGHTRPIVAHCFNKETSCSYTDIFNSFKRIVNMPASNTIIQEGQRNKQTLLDIENAFVRSRTSRFVPFDPDKHSNAYTQKKRLSDFYKLNFWDLQGLVYDERDNRLIMPIYTLDGDTLELATCQFLTGEGNPYGLKGISTKACFFPIGGAQAFYQAIDNYTPIALVEGLATGLAVRRLANGGYLVLAVTGINNFVNVVNAFKNSIGSVTYVMMDNDYGKSKQAADRSDQVKEQLEAMNIKVHRPVEENSDYFDQWQGGLDHG